MSVLFVLAARSFVAADADARSVSYTELQKLVREDKIGKVEISSSQIAAALMETEGRTRLGRAKETLDRNELLSSVSGSQVRMSIEPTPKVGAVS